MNNNRFDLPGFLLGEVYGPKLQRSFQPEAGGREACVVDGRRHQPGRRPETTRRN